MPGSQKFPHQIRSRIASRASFAVFAFALMVVVSVTGAIAGVCVKKTEAPALQTRMVQTELMVAALTCQRRTDYNGFVEKFKPDLAARGQALKDLFRRLHGDSAEQNLNQFVTRIANEASLRSIQTANYCAAVDALFADLDGLVPGKLSAYAATWPPSNRHGLALCADAS